MNFAFGDMLSCEEILADALLQSNDPELKSLNKGWYIRQVKNGLEALNFNTFFNEVTFDCPMPVDLRMNIPTGSWNIKDIYVFSGNCCDITTSARVFHKSNFLSNGKNKGYTAHNKTGQADPYIVPFSYDIGIYFYNIQNGIIYLSDSCANFEKLRIVYNGTTRDIEKSKIIPPFAREALIAYVVERALYTLKNRNPQLRASWMDARNDLYGDQGKYRHSKWTEAEMRLKDMDKKERTDLMQYLSEMNY